MKLPAIDPVTLDAMVRADPAPAEAWASLVASSEGAHSWAAAVKRRAVVDSVSLALIRYPWIASLTKSLRSIREKMSVPDFSVQLWPRQALLNAVLAPSNSEPDHVMPLDWGSLTIRELALGETVHLSAERPGQVRVFALNGQATQLLPTASWELEANEAPVVLLAIAQDMEGASVQTALAAAAPMAGVILLERRQADNAPFPSR